MRGARMDGEAESATGPPEAQLWVGGIGSGGGGEEASVPGGHWRDPSPGKGGVSVRPRRAQGRQKGATVAWFQGSTRNPVLRRGLSGVRGRDLLGLRLGGWPGPWGTRGEV